MKMRILTHRGLWHAKPEQNTPAALRLSFERGWGIETDIRDRDGALVVSHDCPNEASPLLADCWPCWSAMASPERPLALNVKSDGLAAQLAPLVSGLPADSAFFFDMSVPDMRAYLKLGLPVYTRHSDAEPVPAYYPDCAGVWLDALDGPWPMEAAICRHLDAGKAVAVVSEELHGRPCDRQWRMLKSFRDEPRVLVCTDHPSALEDALA
jgi:hypothetical protein